jgi:hypothetical protein
VREAAVVNQVVDSSGVQYPVIAGLRTETGPERLVIAYPNEKTLRDLIAAASILAAGFSSHEEAVAGRRAHMPTVISDGMQEATTGRDLERNQWEVSWAESRGEEGSTLRRLARFFVTSYRDVATAAIVTFSSRNAVSTVIRMALGSSV